MTHQEALTCAAKLAQRKVSVYCHLTPAGDRQPKPVGHVYVDIDSETQPKALVAVEEEINAAGYNGTFGIATFTVTKRAPR